MNNSKFYSVRDLKALGWTVTAIKNFLPAIPDDSCPNPKYPNAGAPMKFWLRARVHRVQKTRGFLVWKERAAERSAAAHEAVSTRIDNMVARMETVEITIVRGRTDKQIESLARATHGGNYRGDPGPFFWDDRTARNCIRHNLTNYEALWKICNRGATGEEAYDVLRERVDDLIDEAYPQYAEFAADRKKAAK